MTGTTTVSYKNTWGETEIIRDGDTLNVTTVEDGTFSCGSYPVNAADLYWTTTWDSGEEQNKPIWIGSQSGKLSVNNPGTVRASVKVKSTGQVLCNFQIKAANPVLEDFKMYIDGDEVTDTYTVAGHQWKNVLIKGKLEGSDRYVPFNEKITLEKMYR